MVLLAKVACCGQSSIVTGRLQCSHLPKESKMAVSIPTDSLYSALNSVKKLRTFMGDLFKVLSSGGVGCEKADKFLDSKFVEDVQDYINKINQAFRDLEQSTNNLSAPAGPFSLGNSALLSQESVPNKQALYKQLVKSFKWNDKVHEYSAMSLPLLSFNLLKRSHANSSPKRRRIQPNCHNVPPQVVDSAIAFVDRLFPNMTMSVTRPYTSNAVLQITLGRVFQGLISFKGLMIEWVMIKGLGEQLDLWTESRYKVFQKVTENTHAAMLHFYSPTIPDYAIRSFMTWLHSYQSLFSDPCKSCHNHLHNNMPPTWRDYRSLEPYHEECKH
ncbi:mediator of RNA polymerase II transcription subunit 27 [Bemisia tabaci]